MRIATWNVNSIKAHFDQVTTWVKAEKPDVLCLHELKCEDHAFPAAAFEELPAKLPSVFAADSTVVCQPIRYSGADENA